jgi:hypothetical protein
MKTNFVGPLKFILTRFTASALYTVHCSLFTVHCSMYTVHCTLRHVLTSGLSDTGLPEASLPDPLQNTRLCAWFMYSVPSFTRLHLFLVTCQTTRWGLQQVTVDPTKLMVAIQIHNKGLDKWGFQIRKHVSDKFTMRHTQPHTPYIPMFTMRHTQPHTPYIPMFTMRHTQPHPPYIPMFKQRKVRHHK